MKTTASTTTRGLLKAIGLVAIALMAIHGSVSGQSRNSESKSVPPSQLSPKLVEYLDWLLLGQDKPQIPEHVTEIFGTKSDKEIEWTSEYRPILQKLTESNYRGAIYDADQIINRPLSAFRSEADAAWQKSLAMRLKAFSQIRTGEGSDALVTVHVAAEIAPDKDLLEGLSNIYAAHFTGRIPTEQLRIDKAAYIATSKRAASLGSLSASDILLTEGSFTTEQERIYWEAMNAFLEFERTITPGSISLDKPHEGHLDEVIAKYGEDVVARAVAAHGLGPATVVSKIPGLPDRDVRRAMLLQWVLISARKTFFQTLGFNDGGVPPTITVREGFQQIRDFGAPYPATWYMVVPNLQANDDPQIVGSSARAIMSEISSGDVVFLRCGPLSHVAFLQRANRENGTLDFADPIYEYWQPTHNDCVSSFDLVKDGDPSIYVSRIRAADVEEMLQAVFTLRNPRR